MKAFTILAFLSAFTSTLGRPTEQIEEEEEGPDCTVVQRVKLSFYGRQDVLDPIAYPECGRKMAGGRGTYDSPLTMASAPGAFQKCEIVFIPYLLKYVRFEDICMDCVQDYSKGKTHMSIWTGNRVSGRREQIQCQKDFTPHFGLPIIQTPPKSMLTDIVPLYKWGDWNPCALDHRYKVINENAFCFDTKTERVEDHWKDQQNSVQPMRHPYARPWEEQPVYEEQTPPESPQQSQMQDQSLLQQQSQDVALALAQQLRYSSEDPGWGLVSDDPAATSKEQPRIVL